MRRVVGKGLQLVWQREKLTCQELNPELRRWKKVHCLFLLLVIVD